MKYIPVYEPYINGNEKSYLLECIESTWISSKGKFIDIFEENFAKYLGVKYASTTSSGTTALHLALLALGIKEGDEVIIPTLTYVATANAIKYVNAQPIFVDSMPDTWQINPYLIEQKITSKTKAILVVHLYGHPVQMDVITEIAKRNNLYLIEDCAEALGSKFNDKLVGGFGDISVFSFFGNKTITTGEGGMVVSNNSRLIENVKKFKNQGVSKEYYHDIVGYNYRMTNMSAAIGVAQLEVIDVILEKKQNISRLYKRLFRNSDYTLHFAKNNVFHSYWMNSILVPSNIDRDKLRSYLQNKGIDSRPLFYPIHSLPMYNSTKSINEYPVSNYLSKHGINLPSSPNLDENMIKYIVKTILDYKNGCS